MTLSDNASRTAQHVYKIAPRQAWSQGCERGIYEGSGDDRRDGFIHLSAAHQIEGTLARHFSEADDIVLIAFDATVLGAALRWEASRGGAVFPHLYAALDPTSALWVNNLERGPFGRHIIPAQVGRAA